jgi:hypothetical protein
VVFVFFSAIGGFSGAPPPFDCAIAAVFAATMLVTRMTNVKRDLGRLCMILVLNAGRLGGRQEQTQIRGDGCFCFFIAGTRPV